MSDDTPVHLLDRTSNYDKHPSIPAGSATDCFTGWSAIAGRLRATGARTIVVEAYPGVSQHDLEALARELQPDSAIDAAGALKDVREVERLVAADVTDDPVFGRLSHLTIQDFFDSAALARLQKEAAESSGLVVVFGTGASLVARGDVVVYADMRDGNRSSACVATSSRI